MKTSVVVLLCVVTVFAEAAQEAQKPNLRKKRATCSSAECSYDVYCLSKNANYIINGNCVKCDPNGNGVINSCYKAPYCWKQGTTKYNGVCYTCSSSLVLTEECHVCGTDTCLAKNGGSVTIGDMTYTCGSAEAQTTDATTTSTTTQATTTTAAPSSQCSCVVEVSGVNHTVSESSNSEINCNEWSCAQDASGNCGASVVNAGCKKADGSCASVGTTDGCNRECIVGDYSMGTWNNTKCAFADGTCVEVGSSLHCYHCGSDFALTKTGCRSASDQCFSPDSVDGCFTCGSDFNWLYQCKRVYENGSFGCFPESTTFEAYCKTKVCEITSTHIGFVDLSTAPTKCYYSGSCLTVGDIQNCHVCKADGTMEWKCKKTHTDGSYDCYAEGATVESGCQTNICTVTSTSVGFVKDDSVPTKCNFAGTCLTQGQTMDCHYCKSDGSMDWRCMDTNGNCHLNGDTWDTCTCSVVGNQVNITCTS